MSEIIRHGWLPLNQKLRNFARLCFVTVIAVSVSLLFFPESPRAGNLETTGIDMSISDTQQTGENYQVSFVSLRNRTESGGVSDYFGGQRGTLRAGNCTVSFSPIWGLEELANSAPFYIPDEKIDVIAIQEKPIDELLDEIEAFSKDNDGNIILYIHGYNIDFEKGCRHSAVLQRSLGIHDRLLFFSWPADGNVLKYTWDEADLVWSAPHMADFLQQMVNRTGHGKIDIVAHSLGARGVVQALTRLSYKEQPGVLLDNLVLIAPDIDTDIFRHDLPLLKRVINRITIYVSENDKALKLSREVHGYPRLGEAGDSLSTFAGVETIDISSLSLQRISGHVYHLSNQEVIEDLKVLLHTKALPDQRSVLQKLEKDGLPYWQLLPGEPQ